MFNLTKGISLLFAICTSFVCGKEPIYFNGDETFKIVTFTDLHYGEGPGSNWGPMHDNQSTKLMTDILEWEHPDFVVYTGDLLSAEVMFPNGSQTVDQLLQPAVKGKFRWASAYGNHDIGNNVTREEILQAEQRYNLSYTQQGEDGLIGTTNYYVPIYPPKVVGNESEGAPTLILWFFDSRGSQNLSARIPSYVHETVVEWFRRETESLNQTWGPIPSLAFFHIPTKEYKLIQKRIKDHPECPGQAYDEVKPQEKDTGLMDALLNSGNVRATFIGHSHGNGWCCYFKTMNLCYNRQTGYGGRWGGWMRGSRVITLKQKELWGTIPSYVRLEDGNVTDHFPVLRDH